MAPLSGDQGTFAHDVALSPLAMRKEHTPAEQLVLLLGWQTEEVRRRLSYAPAFGSASDPRHLTAGANSLASRA